MKRTAETGATAGPIDLAALIAGDRPLILKGQAALWPLVEASRAGPAAAIAALGGYDTGHPLLGYRGAPEIDGRFFYRDDGVSFNFQSERAPLRAWLDLLLGHLNADAPPSFYLGSTDLDAYLPGVRRDGNDLALPLQPEGFEPPTISIWIGNRTVAATHYDASHNLACCVAGRRRFTLFPPDQIGNLYPGPLDPTPGGQVVSMVDPRAPDHQRYPRFAEAMAAAEVAELEPGDVLFYPALWWHQVEALDPFNAMINYWWNAVPAFVDSPATTLAHGLLSLRGRSASEKQAWRALFDYYLFGASEAATTHLQAAAHGDLAPLDRAAARRLRARLLQRLNR